MSGHYKEKLLKKLMMKNSQLNVSDLKSLQKISVQGMLEALTSRTILDSNTNNNIKQQSLQ
jgi:hypothetical protein